MFFNNPYESRINIIPSSINGAIGILVENYIELGESKFDTIKI